MFTALRRLQEEDPTIDLHRDEQTGEQIVAGLSQMHVEVIVGRMKERFGAEVTLKPPRVPVPRDDQGLRQGARAATRSRPAAAASSATATSRSSRCRTATGFEFVNAIKGGVIPTGFIPAVEKGIVEAMVAGVVAGYPVKGVRVRALRRLLPLGRLVGDGVQDGRLDGVQAGGRAGRAGAARADHDGGGVACPSTHVGDVIGDLNSRRGRPLGMEPKGSMTEVKAEVPMAEMLSYAPDLRSITGGQGDYTMEFARYEEVPAHLAQKVIAAAGAEARPRGLEPKSCLTPASSIEPAEEGASAIHDDVACDVCGRTILKGERTEAYLAPGGQRHIVCELCTDARLQRGLDPRVGAHGLPAVAAPAGGAPLAVRADARAATPRTQDGAARSRRRRGRLRRRRRRRPEPAEAEAGRAVRDPAAAARRAAAPPRRPPRPRRADQRPGEGRARARAVQQLRARAHDRRHRAHARRAVGERRCRSTRRPARCRSSSPGSCPGTATGSTSATTRRPGHAARARATSSTSSTRRCATGTRASTTDGQLAVGGSGRRPDDLLRRSTGARRTSSTTAGRVLRATTRT